MSLFKNTKPVNSIEEFENQLVNQLTEHYTTTYKNLKVPEVTAMYGAFGPAYLN